MADSGPRRRRLLALLPTIFASQPETSAVSTVIEAMAVSLAELDANLTRTQRDHWVKLAASDGSALERLGALLGIARLTWTETANDADGNPAKITREEAIEAYRQRLQLTARVLTQGLTTPRALLELAIATLGAEPCPRQKRHRDATLALGFPLGTLRRCPACATGRPGPCPYAGQQVLDAWITDNPPHRRVLAWDKPLRPSGQISVDNPALDEDVPELRLKAMDQAVQYPYLQNQATGEVIFYAGTIQPGEVLSLWPQVEAEETRRYISHEPVDPHVWRKQYPSGSAVLIGVDGRIKPVSADIYSLSGAKFPLANVALGAADAPRFASMEDAEGVRFADALNQGDIFDVGAVFTAEDSESCARFGDYSQRVRTPRMLPGENIWSYGIYTRQDIEAIVANQTGALLDNAPATQGDATVMLTLSWWVCTPATFRLRIPRTGWVGAAEARGAAALFNHGVRQAKAAGVAACVDFPQPQLREDPSLGDQLMLGTRQRWQEVQPLQDNEPHWQLQARIREKHPLADGGLTFRGVFDNTRLDGSHFDAPTP